MKRQIITGSLAALLVLAPAACTKRLPKLDVDLYLHPEAGNSDDILLQTAIRKRLETNQAFDGVYVRVVESIAVVSGRVKTAELRQHAEALVRGVKVKVDADEPMTVTNVVNRLKVE